MVFIENNGKISKLTTDSPTTLTHSPVKVWDMAGWSVDGLEALVNSTPYQLLIDCLPLVGGEIVKVAIVYDEKAMNVPGGTFTAGAWRVRDLNTKIDPDNLVSLSSNAITILNNGKYWVRASAPASHNGYHKARLLLNGNQIAMGSNELLPTYPTSPSVSRSLVAWTGQLTENNTLVLEHHCSNNAYTASTGFGTLTGFGTEVYSIVEIIKLS